jgi:uncharacterized protein (TIGR02271 family)
MTRRNSTQEPVEQSQIPAPHVNEPVIDRSGKRAVVRHIEAGDSGQPSRIVVALESGEELILSSALLQRTQEGMLTLPFAFVEVDAFDEVDRLTGQDSDESIVIPVVTEELSLRKEERITGRVRITKTVHEREALLEETIHREEVNVERVSINRVVDEIQDQYYEGETLVIPIYTEVLVVEKRLMLAEELRITKHRYEQPVQKNVTLRDEEVNVERFDNQP